MPAANGIAAGHTAQRTAGQHADNRWTCHSGSRWAHASGDGARANAICSRWVTLDALGFAQPPKTAIDVTTAATASHRPVRGVTARKEIFSSISTRSGTADVDHTALAILARLGCNTLETHGQRKQRKRGA